MCRKSTRKGMILVAGKATRLYPITEVIPKSMLPIYDKPMIYYPLYTLMQAGVRDIMILVSPANKDIFVKVLGDGSRFGIKLTYVVQEKAKGIAQAFILGEKFIGTSDVAMVLGDNIFYATNPMHMQDIWQRADDRKDVATIFGYPALKLNNFGVVEVAKNGDAISIEEKPAKPKSNLAVPGIYFYPNDVVEKAKLVKPSARGELEITSINDMYLKEKRLKVEKLDKMKWFDTGTPASLFETNVFMESKSAHSTRIVSCPEEMAFLNGWINKKKLKEIAKRYKPETEYHKFLQKLYSGNDAQL